MNIALFVNDIEREKPGYSTTRLAEASARREHSVWYVDVQGISYQPDEHLSALAYPAPKKVPSSREEFLEAIVEGAPEHLDLEALDVLMLRNNPADDYRDRPWAQGVGISFGEIAARRGVLVVNDPRGLSHALNKLYFQDFPRHVRPRTLISRDPDEIRTFVEDEKGDAVLKPLQGSGGTGVFLVDHESRPNLNQMIEAISRDGYVVAQEYLPEAEKGDVRVLLVNGRPLEVEGEYAAFRRRRASDDVRSNISVGGKPEETEVDDTILEVCAAVRPKLVSDGMFFVGLDLVGEKLMEVNVFSPAGLGIEDLAGVDFTSTVVAALERKLEHAAAYPGALTNAQLAVL